MPGLLGGAVKAADINAAYVKSSGQSAAQLVAGLEKKFDINAGAKAEVVAGLLNAGKLLSGQDLSLALSLYNLLKDRLQDADAAQQLAAHCATLFPFNPIFNPNTPSSTAAPPAPEETKEE